MLGRGSGEMTWVDSPGSRRAWRSVRAAVVFSSSAEKGVTSRRNLRARPRRRARWESVELRAASGGSGKSRAEHGACIFF
jgi:hypothetical protein